MGQIATSQPKFEAGRQFQLDLAEKYLDHA